MRLIACMSILALAHSPALACDLRGDDVTAGTELSAFRAKHDGKVACSDSVFDPPPILACFKFDQKTGEKIEETVANKNADIAYMFYDAKLGVIQGTFSFSDFHRVSEAFSKKWGMPTSIDAKKLTTALGTEIESLELHWVRPGCTIMLFQHFKRAGQSAFAIAGDWVLTTREDQAPDL